MGASLAELMSPATQVKMARYENHRIAVAKGYEIAAQLATKDTSNTLLVAFARSIALNYKKDLDEAIELIEEKAILPVKNMPIAHS